MHTNGSCHGFCRYCQSQIPHDTCRELGSSIINYTTRGTQTYRDDRENYNLYERDIEAKQRPGQNLPADSQYTMVMPQRNEHPHAVRVMNTAPLTDWFRGWPPTHELWSRPVQHSTSTTVSTSTTSVASTSLWTSSTTTLTSNTTPAQQRRLQRATDPIFCYDSRQSQPIYLITLSQPHRISKSQLLSHGLNNLSLHTYSISIPSAIT